MEPIDWFSLIRILGDQILDDRAHETEADLPAVRDSGWGCHLLPKDIGREEVSRASSVLGT
jgi:hypothetical protein